MSELLNKKGHQAELRRRLLITASAVALLASTYGAGKVFAANDADRPVVWLELGGQLERVDAEQEPFAPPFEAANEGATYRPISPLDVERLSRYGIGGEGKISLQPKGSDWIFSAGVVYGRSNSSRHVHQQTEQKVKQLRPILSKYLTSFHGVTKFSDVTAGNREAHTVLDFMAGKDVGLGMLRGHSTLSFGVRFAQFNNTSDAVLRSFPDQYFGPIYHSPASDHHHSFYGVNHVSRSFRGLGPSLSWNGAAPIVGDPETTQLTFDWGANAAVLFGRQKASGEHKTTGRFFTGTYFFSLSRYQHTAPINRSRYKVVPNAGGFAGVTFRRANAKVGFGYRADFFFGAMDGGIDTHKSETVGFYGPFATISIGLGG